MSGVKVQGNISPHQTYVNDLTYIHNDRYLITASGDHTIQMWNEKLGKMKGLSVTTSWVTSLQISPDNKWLATGGKDAQINIWDLESRTKLFQILGHQYTVKTLRFIKNNQLVSLGNDKQAKLWQLVTINFVN